MVGPIVTKLPLFYHIQYLLNILGCPNPQSPIPAIWSIRQSRCIIRGVSLDDFSPFTPGNGARTYVLRQQGQSSRQRLQKPKKGM